MHLDRLAPSPGALLVAGALALAPAACTPPADDSATGTSDADTDTATDADGDTDTDTDPPIFLFSSGGGGSTVADLEWEYVEEECPTDCAGNTDPIFDPLAYLVNGTWAASPSPVAGDEVAVLVAYADAECNLACGAQYYSWESPEGGEADAGSLPSNLPCDTAGSNVYLGFDLGVVQSGDYAVSLRVEDACGGETPRSEASFSVP